MKTYGDAADLLRTFLSTSPDPDSIGTTHPEHLASRGLTEFIIPGRPAPRDTTTTVPGPDDAHQLLLRALRTRAGSFDPARAAPWRDQAVQDTAPTGASWYRKSAQPAPTTSNPVWSFDDTIGTASMLAFAVPYVGMELSAGISAVGRVIDNLCHNPGEAQPMRESMAEAITHELETYLGKAAVNDELRTVISRVTQLKSHMSQMLNDPQRVTSAKAQGFNAKWVNASLTKDWVLGPEFLGSVWTVVDSDAFVSLATESKDTPYQQGPDQDLVEAPTLAMCTVDAYAQVTGTVVNALILYSLVALMPEDALKPGWDPSTFSLVAAVRTPAWQQQFHGRSAYDCWETLCTYLDPEKPSSWIARVDPQTGDARQAFDRIKKRLDRITFGFTLPNHRDDLWFLEADKSVGYELGTSETPHPDDFFRGCCAANQSEVKDTALTERGDAFATPYRSFKTRLGIDWRISSSTGDILGGVFSAGTTTAVTAARVHVLNENDGHYYSPWNESSGDNGVAPGTYAQLCWSADEALQYAGEHPMSIPMTMFRSGTPPNIAVEEYKVAPLLMNAAQTVTAANLPHSEVQHGEWILPWIARGDRPPELPAPPAPTQSFGFMDAAIGRDVVGWMGFVLAHYAEAFNYKLDTARNVSTLTVANLFHDAWLAVHDSAKTMLAAGAPAATPAVTPVSSPALAGAGAGSGGD